MSRIGILHFSPTNTTKKTCEAIATGMGSDNLQIFNMTLPKLRSEIAANPNMVTENIDHLIIGSPVYSGKLPIQVIKCLNSLKGNGKECTAIVVYGNRDYGISLYNMGEILMDKGFRVIAAGAFIGQHTYADIVPVAVGRPDESDIEKANNFGKMISNSASDPLSLEDIPKQIDKYSKSDKYSSLKPTHIKKLCLHCGECAKNCPTGIISPEDGTFLSRAAKKQCNGCLACVAACKEKARVAKANKLIKFYMGRILKEASINRQETLTILA